jgi:DNA invertase Pin-like site-specific DNA recombinase
MGARKDKMLGKNSVDMDPRGMLLGTRVWVYLRHSPGDNQTLESQEAAILKLVKEKQWLIDRIFRDAGISGKSVDTRKDFERMIYLAKQKPRPADLIVIWDLSRFSRDQIHAQLYRAQLRSDGWQILSMNDDIPSGPLGHIFESLIDWKNETYLLDLRVNTMRGLRYIAERGCIPVGGVCHGYIPHDVQIGTYHDGAIRYGRKPEIDPKIAPLVIQAFEMKAQGAPHSAISEKTGLYPSQAGSWDYLFRNRAFIGEFEFQDEVFKDIYPAILTKELFEAVQKRLTKRKQTKIKGSHHPRRKGSTYFLADIAICMHCGSPMEGKSAGKYRYYICSRHNSEAGLCPKAGPIPADELETKFFSIISKHVLQKNYLQDLLAWTNEQLNSGLEELNLRLVKLEKEYSESEWLSQKMTRNFGLMDQPTRTAETALHDQENKSEQLRLELIATKQEIEESQIKVEPDYISRFITQAQTIIERAELFDLREFCEQICSQIVMSRDECRIELHFPVI